MKRSPNKYYYGCYRNGEFISLGSSQDERSVMATAEVFNYEARVRLKNKRFGGRLLKNRYKVLRHIIERRSVGPTQIESGL